MRCKKYAITLILLSLPATTSRSATTEETATTVCPATTATPQEFCLKSMCSALSYLDVNNNENNGYVNKTTKGK